MSVIGWVSQTTCASVPAEEVKVIVPSGFTVIVPSKLMSEQLPPRVVTVYGYTWVVVIFTDGVPNMVTWLAAITKFTPVGSPETVALVAPALNS